MARSKFSGVLRARLGGAVSALAVALGACPAYAQGGDIAPRQTAGQQEADDSAAAEIIVTAQKRSENLQKVAAAVDVVSGEEIIARGVTDLTRLTNLTTGILLTPQRSSLQIFSRGLGQSDGMVQTTPSVEIDLDGINLPKAAQQLALFDLENIQVLKGPQGILYGRNAIGGAVVVTTRKPLLNETSFDGLAEVGNYDYRHLVASVSIPLGGVAALRGTVNYEKHSGYLTNGANDLDSFAGRLTLLVEPADWISLTVSGLYVDRDGRGFVSQTLPFAPEANGDPWYANRSPTSPLAGIPAPAFSLAVPENNRGFYRSNATFLNANLRVELSNELTLSYLPGYLNFKNRTLGATYYTPAGAFQSYQAVDIGENLEEYSNELRLNYDRTGLHIVAGALQHHLDAPFNFARLGYNGATFLNGPLNAKETNYALFANADIDILPELHLTLGARQSWDQKTVDGTFGGRRLVLTSSNFPQFKNFSWKVGLSYEITPRIMVYGHIQTSYLPGHYQTTPVAYDPPPAGLGLPIRVKEQTLTAYTAGFKSRLFDDRVTLNAEAFYYDYNNFHVNQRLPNPLNATATVTPYANVRKARIYGADVDLSVRVFENGRATVGLSLLNAEIVDSGLSLVLVMDRNGIFQPAPDPSLRGYRLPYSPTVTLNLGYEHTFPLADGAEITASVSSHHESSRWLDYAHPQSIGAKQDGFWKTDASLTYYSPDKSWNLGAWVRNLENKATYSGYSANSFRSVPGGPITGTFGTATIDAPRTYGVRAGVNF